MTHEEFLNEVREHLASTLVDDLARVVRTTKLVYGTGAGARGRRRGVTVFDAWQGTDRRDMVEICAVGETSPVQIAGTILHEFGHVIAGATAGHSAVWRNITQALGLLNAAAAGQVYQLADFADVGLAKWLTTVRLDDGEPRLDNAVTSATRGVPQPCSAGVGTRGGTSRGVGSGSRLRKWQCACGVIARVASDDFRANCDRCRDHFRRA